MKTDRRLIVPLMALLLAMPALAQQPQGGAGAEATETLTELRAEARRLTALAAVPAEGRAEAEALLERKDALAERERFLEVARLRAYIAALRDGDSVVVAREVAAEAVAQERVALAREREALEADIEAFLEAHPEATAVLKGRLGAAYDVLSRVPDGLNFRHDLYFNRPPAFAEPRAFHLPPGAIECHRRPGVSRAPNLREFSTRSLTKPFCLLLPYGEAPGVPGVPQLPPTPRLPRVQELPQVPQLP